MIDHTSDHFHEKYDQSNDINVDDFYSGLIDHKKVGIKCTNKRQQKR